jgi:hypothetical protein
MNELTTRFMTAWSFSPSIRRSRGKRPDQSDGGWYAMAIDLIDGRGTSPLPRQTTPHLFVISRTESSYQAR